MWEARKSSTVEIVWRNWDYGDIGGFLLFVKFIDGQDHPWLNPFFLYRLQFSWAPGPSQLHTEAIGFQRYAGWCGRGKKRLRYTGEAMISCVGIKWEKWVNMLKAGLPHRFSKVDASIALTTTFVTFHCVPQRCLNSLKMHPGLQCYGGDLGSIRYPWYRTCRPQYCPRSAGELLSPLGTDWARPDRSVPRAPSTSMQDSPQI